MSKTKSERVKAGEAAKKFADNPAFIGACENLKQMYRNDWERSKAGDTEKREQIFQKLIVLDEVILELEKAKNDLKAAMKQ